MMCVLTLMPLRKVGILLVAFSKLKLMFSQLGGLFHGKTLHLVSC